MEIFNNAKRDRDVLEQTIEKAKKIGIENLMIASGRNESHELNVNADNINLFRTTFTEIINIVGFIGHKKGSISINTISMDEIDIQLKKLKEIINSSLEDPANELAPFEAIMEFEGGNLEFSKEEMVERLEEFIKISKSRYPFITFEEAILDYSRGYSYLISSNGTVFHDRSGKYYITASFSSREDKKVSSFNYTYISKKDLKKPIIEWENIDTLLKQNVEHLRAKKMNSKFTGSIIFTPSSIGEIISFLLNSLKDYEIISGTSIYKDSVEKSIASDKLTIEANPLCDEFVLKSYFTSDGFLTKPITILEKGVLKTLLLSYYGSLKTGKKRALNYGSGIIVDGEKKPLAELIKTIDKGILLERFSGGDFTPNGDFSGVAKNSYIIENGEIAYPVNEVMISGNYATLLKSVSGVSIENINDGFSILPYLKAEGVNIIGK